MKVSNGTLISVNEDDIIDGKFVVPAGVTIGAGYTDLDMLGDYYSSFVTKEKYPDGFLPKDYGNGYSDAKFKQYVLADFTDKKTAEDLLV